jgi:hypothetical protein
VVQKAKQKNAKQKNTKQENIKGEEFLKRANQRGGEKHVSE